jgi:hypothetical protein
MIMIRTSLQLRETSRVAEPHNFDAAEVELPLFCIASQLFVITKVNLRIGGTYLSDYFKIETVINVNEKSKKRLQLVTFKIIQI